ncbi:Condensin-2 complex subunit G2 [Sesbania bispinosa]|nr:Condensin-2 complex subunit G2 [Sesbania bispinosa]
MFREAFALFDFEDESIEDLKLFLVRCVILPIYMKTEDGRRFLSLIFGLSDQLGKELLAMIRSQIPFGRKSMLEAFGDILFRAWKAAQVDSRGEIENGFLQDLIDAAIHASSGAFASYIRRVLRAFINQRTIDGVEKLLYRLAEPVIFSPGKRRPLSGKSPTKKGVTEENHKGKETGEKSVTEENPIAQETADKSVVEEIPKGKEAGEEIVTGDKGKEAAGKSLSQDKGKMEENWEDGRRRRKGSDRYNLI